MNEQSRFYTHQKSFVYFIGIKKKHLTLNEMRYFIGKIYEKCASKWTSASNVGGRWDSDMLKYVIEANP